MAASGHSPSLAAAFAALVLWRSRGVPLAIAAVTSSCAIMGNTPPTVSLRVQGNVGDAQVTIDDQPIGALAYVAAHGVALPPGKHRVTVEKVGYFPWDAVLEADDEPIHLDIKLVPIPD
jgi:hypothetical protein